MTNRHLAENTAAAVVEAVRQLGEKASFRGVLLECRKRGVVKWDRTLRAYLDLLLLGGVLSQRLIDVGSVYPKELYTFRSNIARVHVGVTMLIHHGLNWDLDEPDVRVVRSDFAALVRAEQTKLKHKVILAACIEDCIAYEFIKGARTGESRAELLAALMATTKLDLAYLFERADRLGVGESLRQLFRETRDALMSAKTEADGRAFLAVRERFLKLARQYSSSGLMNLADERGKGSQGLNPVRGIHPVTIVTFAAKQMGVMG
jgi:hypothetical protein